MDQYFEIIFQILLNNNTKRNNGFLSYDLCYDYLMQVVSDKKCIHWVKGEPILLKG